MKNPIERKANIARKARARSAQIYRAAARFQDYNIDTPSCWAVRRVNRSAEEPYRRMMFGGEQDVTIIWGAGKEYCEETKQVRVLLLCLMAAMVEAGDA